MKEYFDEFVKDYDLNNPRLNYKYYHNYRVMNDMAILSKHLNLSSKDIHIAKCIGLFHDIGRFIQYEKIKDFNDIILDHGDIGVTYLKEHNALDYCNIPKEDYGVVYKAIKNHNKFVIDRNLNERELLFTKLIRDADKIDILYALGNKKIKPEIKEDDTEISPNVADKFFKGKIIKKSDAKNKNDKLIITFSFIFDIYLDKTMDIIKTNNYYNKIYKRLKNKNIFAPYIKYTNKYITERTDKNARKEI